MEMLMVSATIIESWNRRWATDEGRADFLEPHPEVVALLPVLKSRGASAALDLGCGVGRHSLFLADAGLDVEAMDASATGLEVLRQTATARNLTLEIRHADADSLPFPEATFDFVLSWDVIYHGNLGDVGRRIAEIWRVLKPGGLFQCTMLPWRNNNYGVGRQVAPGTFVVDGDEHHSQPHFYCDATTLLALFSGFEIFRLSQHQKRKPGSWHWNVVAERSNERPMLKR
jgi:tellurite methyltransferase